jgi:hypothetical protein
MWQTHINFEKLASVDLRIGKESIAPDAGESCGSKPSAC